MIPTALTYDFIKSQFSQKGYIFREENEFANIFAFRSKELIVDRFNDIGGVALKDWFGNPQCLIFPCTTKPGLHYLKDELGNPRGTWITQPGQHHNCWKIGLHNGKYEALIQSGPGVFKGWRDLDSDGQFDYSGPTYNDSSGVDLHTTRFDVDVTDVVDRFSAGCTVIRDDKHFEVLLNLVKRTMEVFKITLVDYTLFQEA